MEEGNWYASTLARGLSLIEAFGHDAVWLGNAELARRTGLSKPTVSRLSATLVELGYLNRGEGGKVQPGARLLALSYPVLRGLPIRQLARPLMMEVARDIRGAVSIGIASRLSAIMIETARTMEPHPRSPDTPPANGIAGAVGKRRHHAETVGRRVCAPGGGYVRDGLIIGTKPSRARAVASGLPSPHARGQT